MKAFITSTMLGGLIVFFVLSSVIIYKVKFSGDGKRTKENVLNSKKITVGMDEKEVVKIMGHPKETYNSYFEDAEIIFNYEPPLLSSNSVEIYFDKNRKVVRITYAE